MARSFFTGTDSQLLDGSAVFSAKINEDPQRYGLQGSQCVAYAALDVAYAQCYVTARAPQTRTRGTVAAKNDARAALRRAASDLAKVIAANQITAAQRIDLGLNVPAKASPLPPPGGPTDFRVELSADGSVRLAWKCRNPRRGAGTIYQVWRCDGGVGVTPPAYLGASGVRAFVDATIPAGTSQVTYRVQAVRSTLAGPWAEFNLKFGGVDNVGQRPQTAPRIAA